MAHDRLAVLRQARKLTDAVVVGLSGGRDSLVTLDLCCRFFRRVEAYFLYTVPGISFQEQTLHWCERRYGVRIHRLPHWMLSNQLREWTFRGDHEVPGDCPRINLNDSEFEARERSGIAWVATGQRAAESIERRGMLSANQGISIKSRRCYPIAFWLKADVTAYMAQRQIPLPDEYRVFERSWGGRLYPDDLEKIAEHYPDDYARIEEYFPFIGSQLAREKFRKEREAAQCSSK